MINTSGDIANYQLKVLDLLPIIVANTKYHPGGTLYDMINPLIDKGQHLTGMHTLKKWGNRDTGTGYDLFTENHRVLFGTPN